MSPTSYQCMRLSIERGFDDVYYTKKSRNFCGLKVQRYIRYPPSTTRNKINKKCLLSLHKLPFKNANEATRVPHTTFFRFNMYIQIQKLREIARFIQSCFKFNLNIKMNISKILILFHFQKTLREMRSNLCNMFTYNINEIIL